MAGDLRRARAWVLAIAVAMLGTQALVFSQQISPLASLYGTPILSVTGLVIGALLFGLGMSLIGTCGFGLLVRAGSGDMRAILMAMVLGISAFAATTGPLAPLRLGAEALYRLDLAPAGGATLGALLTGAIGPLATAGVVLVIPLALIGWALGSARFRTRQRLILAGLAMGCAVAGGWVVTGALMDPFAIVRLESLTFVGPTGRVVLVVMGETFTNSSFAVMTVLGVVVGSGCVALIRDEFRWEAFDDPHEMRRHIFGAILMGLGGVMARGCTIGQGISGASMLAVTAPIAILGMVVGARLGLAYLIHRPALRLDWLRGTRGRRRVGADAGAGAGKDG